MGQFAIIGLSAFGTMVARHLSKLGHDVLVVDRDKDVIQDARDWATRAVRADATDKQVLERLNLQEMDAVVVSLGDKIDASILVTLFLKELGLSPIIVKGLSEDHRKVLKLVGADEVIFPEQEMAIRVANRISAPHVVDQIELEEGFSIVELRVPKSFVGKTLGELQVRVQYNVEVVLVKRPNPWGQKEFIRTIPDPHAVIEEGSYLVVIGRDEDLEKLKKL